MNTLTTISKKQDSGIQAAVQSLFSAPHTGSDGKGPLPETFGHAKERLYVLGDYIDRGILPKSACTYWETIPTVLVTPEPLEVNPVVQRLYMQMLLGGPLDDVYLPRRQH